MGIWERGFNFCDVTNSFLWVSWTMTMEHSGSRDFEQDMAALDPQELTIAASWNNPLHNSACRK